jgi:hypothetical protein
MNGLRRIAPRTPEAPGRLDADRSRLAEFDLDAELVRERRLTTCFWTSP